MTQAIYTLLKWVKWLAQEHKGRCAWARTEQPVWPSTGKRWNPWEISYYGAKGTPFWRFKSRRIGLLRALEWYKWTFWREDISDCFLAGLRVYVASKEGREPLELFIASTLFTFAITEDLHKVVFSRGCLTNRHYLSSLCVCFSDSGEMKYITDALIFPGRCYNLFIVEICL